MRSGLPAGRGFGGRRDAASGVAVASTPSPAASSEAPASLISPRLAPSSFMTVDHTAAGRAFYAARRRDKIGLAQPEVRRMPQNARPHTPTRPPLPRVTL